MYHKLKTVDYHFSKVWNNDKLFELRLNDKNFQLNDKLILLEMNVSQIFTGRILVVKVKSILNLLDGIKFYLHLKLPKRIQDFVIMSIEIEKRIILHKKESLNEIVNHIKENSYSKRQE